MAGRSAKLAIWTYTNKCTEMTEHEGFLGARGLGPNDLTKSGIDRVSGSRRFFGELYWGPWAPYEPLLERKTAEVPRDPSKKVKRLMQEQGVCVWGGRAEVVEFNCFWNLLVSDSVLLSECTKCGSWAYWRLVEALRISSSQARSPKSHVVMWCFTGPPAFPSSAPCILCLGRETLQMLDPREASDGGGVWGSKFQALGRQFSTS